MSQDAVQKREYFPRGLVQPKAGYLFSLDALLLACFADLRPGSRGMDLGTGCGVVALATLLRSGQPLPRIIGLDRDPAMVDVARANSRLLGFEDVFDVESGDVSSYKPAGNAFDFMLCNPPYRFEGAGRVSPAPGRASARFESESGLEAFVRVARQGLKDKGRFCLVHLPERLPDILECLRGHGLEPKRLRFVHGHAQAPARIVLLEARKNSGQSLAVEPPLLLYAGKAPDAPLLPSALAFCPYLGCNARMPEEKG
ncbi:MAG: methyltransferase [Desulfovibrionaceae bacterium]